MSELDQTKLDTLQDTVQKMALTTVSLQERSRASEEKFGMLMDTVKDSNIALKDLASKVVGTSELKEHVIDLKLKHKETDADLGKYRHDLANVMAFQESITPKIDQMIQNDSRQEAEIQNLKEWRSRSSGERDGARNVWKIITVVGTVIGTLLGLAVGIFF